MTEDTFSVDLPASLLEFGLSREDIQEHLMKWVVIFLFIEGYISSGKAASLLNITRIEFLDLLHTKGIAYINYMPDELTKEFENVTRLEAGL